MVQRRAEMTQLNFPGMLEFQECESRSLGLVAGAGLAAGSEVRAGGMIRISNIQNIYTHYPRHYAGQKLLIQRPELFNWRLIVRFLEWIQRSHKDLKS